MSRYKAPHGVSRKLFSTAEILDAERQAGGSRRKAAAILTGLGRGEVSRELVRFWLKNIHFGNCHTTVTQGASSAAEPEVQQAKASDAVARPSKTEGPRVLVIDIETAPIFGAVWGLFNNFLSLEQVKEDWFILSYSAKWVGEDEVVYRDQRNVHPMDNDLEMLKDVWKLLDEADIVVAHNGRRFDTKKINARFILNGLTPPSPYRVSDTLETAKRNFAFTSNKLAYLTDKLCDTKKRSHSKFPGYLLWQQCLIGNAEAWEEMELYNRDDVLSLEELYLIMLPWDDKAPNHGNFVDSEDPVCPKCGGKHLELQAKPYRTNVGQYELFLCHSCKGWSRGRKLMNTLEQRRKLRSAV